MRKKQSTKKISKIILSLSVLTFVVAVAIIIDLRRISSFEEDVDVSDEEFITSQGFSIRDDGVIMKGNEPYFPYGFVHVSDISNRYGQKMADDVDDMGEANFNFVQLSFTGPNSEQDSALARDRAEFHGMYIIGSYYKPSYRTWIDRLKDEPTVLGWNTNDDFNVPVNNPVTNPTQAFDIAELIRSYAKTKNYKTFTFGSGGGYPFTRTQGSPAYRSTTQIPYLFGDYKNVNEIFGVQSYPISNNDGSFAGAPMEENIAYLKYAKAQLPDNKPLLANLQTFAWEGGGRYPNAREERNMTWATIVARLDGISYYSWHERNGLMSTNAPALWNELKLLRRDISDEFLKIYQNSTYRYFETGGAFGKPRIHAATFEHRNTTTNKVTIYAVVLNTSSTENPTVTNVIELPSNVAGASFKPLVPGDSRYGNGMTVVSSGGKYYLNGSVGIEGVGVYVFEKTLSTTPTSNPTSTVTTTPSPTNCPSGFIWDGSKCVDYSINNPTDTPTTTPTVTQVPGTTSTVTPTPTQGQNPGDIWSARSTKLNSLKESINDKIDLREQNINRILVRVDKTIQEHDSKGKNTFALKSSKAHLENAIETYKSKISAVKTDLDNLELSIQNKNSASYQENLTKLKTSHIAMRNSYAEVVIAYKDEVVYEIKLLLRSQ